MKLSTFVSIVASLAMAHGAAAQGTSGQAPADQPLIDSPPGAVRGWFGNDGPPDADRTRHQLRMGIDLGFGYDDDIEAVGTGLPLPPSEQFLSGPASNGNAELRYRWGSTARALEASGNIYGSRFADVNNWPMGGASLALHSNIGRRSGVNVSGVMTYEPTFLFYTVPGQTEVVESVPVNQTQGVTSQRWLASSVSAGAFHDWTRRQRMTVQFDRLQRQPLEGPGLDNNTQAAQLRHTWNFSQDLGFNLLYRFDENRQNSETGGEMEPLRSNNLSAGLTVTKRLSPTRTLNFAFIGGVTRSVPPVIGDLPRETFIVPTVSVTVSGNVSRRWTLTADVGRDVTALEGFSPEPFGTTSATVRLDGMVARRLSLGFSGVYSSGSGLESGAGSFDNSQATAEVRYAFAPTWALVGSYIYYAHNLHDVLAVPDGFPARFDRRSVRVGLTFWLPLYGTF